MPEQGLDPWTLNTLKSPKLCHLSYPGSGDVIIDAVRDADLLCHRNMLLGSLVVDAASFQGLLHFDWSFSFPPLQGCWFTKGHGWSSNQPRTHSLTPKSREEPSSHQSIWRAPLEAGGASTVTSVPADWLFWGFDKLQCFVFLWVLFFWFGISNPISVSGRQTQALDLQIEEFCLQGSSAH